VTETGEGGLKDGAGQEEAGSRPKGLEGGAAELDGDDGKRDAETGGIERDGQGHDHECGEGQEKASGGLEDGLAVNDVDARVGDDGTGFDHLAGARRVGLVSPFFGGLHDGVGEEQVGGTENFDSTTVGLKVGRKPVGRRSSFVLVVEHGVVSRES